MYFEYVRSICCTEVSWLAATIPGRDGGEQLTHDAAVSQGVDRHHGRVEPGLLGDFCERARVV
jgi:hypothetical protein